MSIYLDLIFLLNFLIDLLLLWMTALLRKKEWKLWRLVLAAMLGASYVFFLFIPGLALTHSFLTKIIYSTIMLFIAFGYKSIQQFLYSALLFYFVSFATGGGMLALHFMLQTNHQVIQGVLATYSGGYGDPISWLFVLFSFPLLLWFSRTQWHKVEQKKLSGSYLAQITVKIHQQELTLQGLIDTGNHLHDPISKKPVILIEPDPLFTLFELHAPIHKHTDGLELMEVLAETSLANRLSIIPYRSAGKAFDTLVAVKPDSVKIEYNQESFVTNQVLLGLSKQGLSRQHDFQAILHPNLLQVSLKEA